MIKKVYDMKKEKIRSRLRDFKKFYTQPVSWFYENNEMKLRPVSRNTNERLFEEIVFCLLTANTSAEMGLKGVDAIRDILFTAPLPELQERLKESGYRYPNKRAEYIIEAREKLKENYELDIKGIIESHNDIKELREWFAEKIKGLGYKESSHFLRNIGIFGLAILDKHILRTLEEYDVINLPRYMNKNKYLEIEEKYKEFSDNININMDELDLLLWSMKNGRILK